jgi:hypothetical protein
MRIFKIKSQIQIRIKIKQLLTIRNGYQDQAAQCLSSSLPITYCMFSFLGTSCLLASFPAVFLLTAYRGFPELHPFFFQIFLNPDPVLDLKHLIPDYRIRLHTKGSGSGTLA